MTETQTAAGRDPNQPIEIFISYSHRDETLKNDLVDHLSPMRREGLIKIWQDRDIDLGGDWAREIDDNVNRADIFLLLVSARFAASDYCFGIEMKRAMERHEAREARVIPIIISHCDFGKLPFARLQAAPKDAMPVTDRRWNSTDEAFTDVAKGIRRVVERISDERSSSGSIV